LFIGEAYTASLTSGSGYGSHGAAIWIDYNDNGIFEEHEMVTYITSMSESSTVDFPEFVVEDYPGTHRLRVQYTHNVEGDELDPCEVSTNYSETEDYMVEIPTLEDCEGTPTAGTVETEMAVCANVAIELSAEGASDPAGGLDRIWQSSPAGENEWTDIEGS